VLLNSGDPSLIVEAERMKDQWWRALFTSVSRWLPHVVAKQRHIWLRFYGLPMHVWDEQSFKKLGALFGEFLDFDDDTINLSRLDMARLLVGNTSMSFINEQLKVEVMGAGFNVWVVEEVVPVMGLNKEVIFGWEDASVSSHDGGRDGDPPEFEELESVASPGHVLSVRLGDLSGPEANCHSLMLRRQLGSAERLAEVGPVSPSHLEKLFQAQPILKRQVDDVGSGLEEHNRQKGEKYVSLS